MNQHQPTAEQFLSSPYDPAEDEEPDQAGPGGVSMTYRGVELTPQAGAFHVPPEKFEGWDPGRHHVLPPNPMERIAEALEALVELSAPVYSIAGQEEPSMAGVSMVPVTAHDALRDDLNEIQQATHEALVDTEAKLHTLSQVLDDVEAALGKSKAAPALAAKAVIEAWKNPTVPEPEMSEEDVAAEAIDAAYAEPEAVPVPVVAANPDNLPGHTRTPHPDGPDFCRECSGEAQEWIQWPCRPVTDGLGSTVGANAVFVPESAAGPQPEVPVAQPAHNAPVEEWREYARSQGFAGPDIDKANRSQIRTALGVAQPVPAEGGA